MCFDVDKNLPSRNKISEGIEKSPGIWYHIYVCHSPTLRQIKGVFNMIDLLNFLISVGAGITANLICDLFRKWLDGHKK